MRPSPSKSPEMTPCHKPVNKSKGERVLPEKISQACSRKWPKEFLKIRKGPHSSVITSSGNPSPSRSVQTHPFTTPTRASDWSCFGSNRHVPWSCLKSLEAEWLGNCPDRARPPTNRSKSPSASISASAMGPVDAGTGSSSTRDTEGFRRNSPREPPSCDASR